MIKKQIKKKKIFNIIVIHLHAFLKTTEILVSIKKLDSSNLRFNWRGDHDTSLRHVGGRETKTTMFREATDQSDLGNLSWLCVRIRYCRLVGRRTV